MTTRKNKMDTIFYLTIATGILTVFLSAVTYYKGKQKELDADKANKELLERTNEVAALQSNLLAEMEKTQTKSDTIISLQNQLQQVNTAILTNSNENIKQLLGSGVPKLSAHFYPDKLIALIIQNDSDYPLYDININLPNPDTYSTAKMMADRGSLLSWDEMRNQWINIPVFNLPPKSSSVFYNFRIPDPMPQTTCFLNITTRSGGFSGLVFIKRENDQFKFKSEVKDLRGKKLSEQHN